MLCFCAAATLALALVSRTFRTASLGRSVASGPHNGIAHVLIYVGLLLSILHEWARGYTYTRGYLSSRHQSACPASCAWSLSKHTVRRKQRRGSSGARNICTCISCTVQFSCCRHRSPPRIWSCLWNRKISTKGELRACGISMQATLSRRHKTVNSR